MEIRERWRVKSKDNMWQDKKTAHFSEDVNDFSGCSLLLRPPGGKFKTSMAG